MEASVRRILDSGLLNHLRRNGGVTVSKLERSDPNLLLASPHVDRLVGEDAPRQLRAIALYGLLYALIKEGVAAEDTRYHDYVALQYALNIGIDLAWEGEIVQVLPEVTGVDKRRDNLAGTNIFPRHVPSSRRELQRAEARAWQDLTLRLFERSSRIPTFLVEWSSFTTSSSAGRIFVNLPKLARPFVGRVAETNEAQRLVAEEGLALITGPPGIGKSQLAAKIIEIAETNGVKHIAQVDCSSTEGFEQFARFGQRLGATKGDALLELQVAETYDHLMATGEPWMLVLDDVRDITLFRRLAPLSSESGAIVVTSTTASLLPGSGKISLGPLDGPSSVQLLTELAGRCEDPDSAAALADELGCYPLALSLAGSRCHDHVSFADYTARLRSEPTEYFEHDTSRVPYYGKTLYQAWKLSFDAACRQADYAETIYLIASHLDGSHIKESFLSGASKEEASRLGLALEALARYSLVERSDGFFVMHSVLQRLGREYSDKSGRGGSVLHLAYDYGRADFSNSTAEENDHHLCHRLHLLEVIPDAYKSYGPVVITLMIAFQLLEEIRAGSYTASRRLVDRISLHFDYVLTTNIGNSSRASMYVDVLREEPAWQARFLRRILAEIAYWSGEHRFLDAFYCDLLDELRTVQHLDSLDDLQICVDAAVTLLAGPVPFSDDVRQRLIAWSGEMSDQFGNKGRARAAELYRLAIRDVRPDESR